MNVHIFIMVLTLKQKFAFNPRSIGFCFLLVPAGILPTVFLLPHLTRRFGLHACITSGCLANVLLCGVLSLPDLHSHSVVLILGLGLAMFFTFTQHNANQARAKMIAAKYAKNATGAVTGVSRTCFALGQAIGPLVSGLIWNWSVSGPFFVLAAIQLSQIVLMMVTRVLCRTQA
jgi:MFS family permease|tara:strand:- start:647 stop:1168 length:522 start_codon:yes stop_codon:yes gene_type:complete